MEKRKKEIPIEGYIFHFSSENRAMKEWATVTSREKGDKRELEYITSLYEKVKKDQLHGRKATVFTCQRCKNPECNNVICMSKNRLKRLKKMGRDIYCSRQCTGKMCGRERMPLKESEKKFLISFQKCKVSQAACLVLDLIQKNDLCSKRKMEILRKKSKEKLKKIIRKIYEPNYPKAQGIIDESEIGEELKNLIFKEP